MENPIVFISYSWDSEGHKEWVLNLANRLRKDGVDVILDRYYLRPGKNVPFFVETSIRRSNRIIIVLTPNYKAKAENRLGGVGQEYSILNNEVTRNISDNERIIPVLRTGTIEDSIPNFFQQYLYISFLSDETYSSSYEELLREIYKEPKVKLPGLGKKPDFKDTLKLSIENEIEEANSPKMFLRTTPLTYQYEEIRKLAGSISSKSYVERKEIASNIYELAPNLPLKDIIKFSKSKSVELNIVAAICFKSYVENLDVDLSANPDFRSFVFYGLNHSDSLLKYRVLDLISISTTLIRDFDKEINASGKLEKDKLIIDKIKSVLNKEEEKDTKSIKEKIKLEVGERISHGDTEGALDKALMYSTEYNDDVSDAITLLKGQYAKLSKEKTMNIISLEDSNLQHNRIAHSLLSILDEI